MAERTGPKARDHEVREHEERLGDAYRPPSNLPDPEPQDGYVFRWIRSSIFGDADNRNVSMRFREGWEPVKAEDHPELMITSDRGSTFEGNIEVGGLILCKTLTENMEKRIAYYDKKARAQQESVDRNYMRQSDPRMPLRSDKDIRREVTERTEVRFGGGRPPRSDEE